MTTCPYCGVVLPPGAGRCPACQSDVSDAADSGPRAEDTRLESAEEVRRALKQRRQGEKRRAAPEAQPYRPVRRPPLAVLQVLDDDQDEGEWVRLRAARTVIGRTEGDVLIGHDDAVSGKHAEVVRQAEGGKYRWYLRDLGSTNGTYIRVESVVLRNGQELLIGQRRYRFQAAGPGGEATPVLVEITPKGEGKRYPLKGADNHVGHDASQCNVALADDPTVSPRHARIYRDGRGRWQIENLRSLNGIWVRVSQVPVDSSCQFQLGEQRFLLKVF
jgi:pSer/pThr/pTyr-binding forkhead associated (FHA) protein